MLVASVLLLVGAVGLLTTGIVTTPNNERLVGDSAAAATIVKQADFGDHPTEMVVVTTRAAALDEATAAQLAQWLPAAYRGVAGVAEVGTPMPGKDGRSIVVPLGLAAARNDDDTTLPKASEVVGPVLEVTRRLQSEHPELVIGQVGPGSIDREIDATLGRDFQRAELVSLPITLVILLIAFGAVVAAGVPLVLGIGSVAVALGLTAAVSHRIVTVDPNAQSLVLLIGLAVGVDYALFIVRRAREERAAGASVEDSIAIAGGTAGRAVVISGLTVMVAMAGMLVAGGLFTSIAIGALLVVGVAVLASATVLPAVLGILGDRVDAWRLPFTSRRTARRGTDRSAWGRLAGAVAAKPARYAVPTVAVLLALAAPALGMRTALPGIEGLPSDLAVVAAYRQLEQAAPSDGTSLAVVVQAPAAQRDQVTAALLAATPAAARIEHVSGVAPAPQASRDGTVHVLNIGVRLDASDARLPGVVERVRAEIVPAVRAALGPTTAQVHVGGEAAATDLSSWMDSRLPWVVGFVLALTLLVMMLSFGSPALAAATVGLNVLSVGAAYGIMTAVFQGTWAQGLLGFTSIGAIASWLPLLLFVVLFGLSMDYHVFVTSRVREAFDAGADPRTAVRLGVARSAGVVTSAAAVMVAVFAVFATLSTLEMKQLGVGLAAAVLLDATVVRGLLLPATMAWLGKRAHTGPAWLPRLHH